VNYEVTAYDLRLEIRRKYCSAAVRRTKDQRERIKEKGSRLKDRGKPLIVNG